ncbi:SDR family oxidoreductase [[Mycobacterium] crassicus]|uniref:3-oxoacyl-[acyl-carrier-protein] reductase MabA n=1 Tax=[Mycobacterium] crassicus TaxID=2872309 RepID=A0ABU5XKI6_9MYCO|nr:SDR family NAD(P)-dependent oxidoreductase [Mycolicibacter sp. MYC098]MEB3022674.1 SDR family NAD(P)-dependent oxidoreductase [Mycolicibacter sp. MYC098]
MTTRVALVTGASGGIGTAIVDRLRRDGLKVVTLDITGDVDVTLDIVNDPFPADVFDHVDICISNAGIVDTIAPAHSMSAEKWHRDIDVNLTGAFRVIQACLPGMRERRYGRVIAVSSLAGKTGVAGKVAYAASKAGLQGAVKTIAIENVGYGITANCVQPGFVETPGLQALPVETQNRLLAAIPVRRFCRPAEVADLIAFLGAESSGYITGQEIAIDGGTGLQTVTIGRDHP